MKRAYGLRNAIALAPKLSLNALKANIASLKSRLAVGQGSAAQKTEARAIIRVLEKARKALIEVMGKEVAAEHVRRHGPLKKNPHATKRFPFRGSYESHDMPYRIGKNDEIYHMPSKGIDPRDYEGLVALKRMLQGGEKVKAPWSKGTKKLPSGVVDGRPSSYRKNGKRRKNPASKKTRRPGNSVVSFSSGATMRDFAKTDLKTAVVFRNVIGDEWTPWQGFYKLAPAKRMAEEMIKHLPRRDWGVVKKIPDGIMLVYSQRGKY